MTIDPRIGLYLSVLMAMLAFIVGAGATLTDLFGPETTKIVLAISTLVLGVGNAVNAVLHAIPSKPGAASEFPLGPKA